MSSLNISPQTPRINAAYLEKWVNHTVRIVGKVTGVQGGMANIDSAGPVTLQLTRDCALIPNNGAEVIGKVMPDGTLKVLTSWDLGPDVDYSIAEAIVDVNHRYKQVFYDS
ncbi:replication factor A protein 3 [Pyronema domesticum]|uniref:Similar to Replication factor A protein 3 acc. no. Q92374 n=1 Tax=Pyronema omphalodes (strain CBS 100304) TaxID=1076935 RepID=U4L4Q8_PYROM|nr:replication factor A protein 3 [Pyronema domesticum]CCX12047.1 Similar to Replication factor A protein 3; acc. no. Q92374 [Pyronema omphalodes CBS 100304]